MYKAILLFLFSINILLANNNVKSTGYGKSKAEALKSAFSNAISQYVGVVVDSKTIIKNNKLIERKILSFSNGYIEDYHILSTKQTATLWEVIINADVNKQGVLSKIKKLKIKNKDIKNSDKIYATLSSKVKTKFDAEAILKKVFNQAVSQETIKSLISFSVDNMNIDIDSATKTTVPVTVIYSVYFDWKSYNQLVNRFDTLFIKLGASIQDVYKLDEEQYLIDPKFQLGNNIFIIKENSTYGFYAYQYKFPKSYKMIYPFATKNWNDLSKKYKYKLSFVDNKNKMTFSKDYEYYHKFFEYINTKRMFSWRKSYLYSQGNSLAIVPAILNNKSSNISKLYTKTEHYNIPIGTLENLKQIKINWMNE